MPLAKASSTSRGKSGCGADRSGGIAGLSVRTVRLPLASVMFGCLFVCL